MLHAWTDGSGTTHDKHAGIGVVLLDDAGLVLAEAGASIGLGTNNVAEVRAIGRALALAYAVVGSRGAELRIYSDSAFALGAVAPGCEWHVRKNRDLAGLVLAVRAEVRKWPSLSFEKVKGHAGLEWNERADVLANLGRKRGITLAATARAA